MENFDKTTMARIHSIETMGTVDGPGLRFVVFMQGCHLKCKYCHNRDTWDTHVGKIVTLSDLIAKIEHYTNYFKASGGGVTLSRWRTIIASRFCSFFNKRT